MLRLIVMRREAPLRCVHLPINTVMLCLCLVAAAAFAGACSGGGGGVGGGAGRTRETALRIVHGSIDAAPVTVRIGDVFLQKAAYAEVTSYVPVVPGPAVVTVERANAPGDIVAQLNIDFRPETEYSLFVVGETRHNDFGVTVIEEPVVRPASGIARLQLLNALPDSAAVKLQGTGFTVGPTGFSASSGFVEVPGGVQPVTVAYDNGRVIGQIELQLEDRGEATVVVSGSGDLRLNFTRVYYDLD